MGDDQYTSFSGEKELFQDSCTIYRGHLRYALLRCLSEKDMHGLEMIHRIKEVTSGEWIPSPGSVYPILQKFEKVGYISKKQKGRSLIYSLTDDGDMALGSFHVEIKQLLNFIDWIMTMK
jgi:DNA-binding PadR family transcriptional regulator